MHADLQPLQESIVSHQPRLQALLQAGLARLRAVLVTVLYYVFGTKLWWIK